MGQATQAASEEIEQKGNSNSFNKVHEKSSKNTHWLHCKSIIQCNVYPRQVHWQNILSCLVWCQYPAQCCTSLRSACLKVPQGSCCRCHWCGRRCRDVGGGGRGRRVEVCVQRDSAVVSLHVHGRSAATWHGYTTTRHTNTNVSRVIQANRNMTAW